MKALYCTQCGDIIAPYRGNYRPRLCGCGRYAVWWRDGGRGLISVYDKEGEKSGAWLLGITNVFLTYPLVAMSPQVIQEMIDQHPDSYLFKSLRSCIVRFSPGMTNDSQWEDSITSGPPLDKSRSEP